MTRVHPEDAPVGGSADGGRLDQDPPEQTVQKENDDTKKLNRLMRWWHQFAQQPPSKNQVPLHMYRRRGQAAIAGCCSISSFILGLLLLSTAFSVFEKSISYVAGDVKKEFVIESDVAGPLYLSYVLPGLKTNQKGFIESKSKFLLASMVSPYKCDPVDTVEQVRLRRKDTEFTSLFTGVDGAQEFRPCGLAAMAMFTDTYTLHRIVDGAAPESISLDQSSVALPKDEDIYKDKVVVDEAAGTVKVEDTLSWLKPAMWEHFKVWYRQPASPTVRNLWAEIAGPLKAGKYELRFPVNSAIWTNEWQVPEKKVLISQANTLGSPGACTFLGAVCLTICGWQAIMTIVILLLPPAKPA